MEFCLVTLFCMGEVLQFSHDGETVTSCWHVRFKPHILWSVNTTDLRSSDEGKGPELYSTHQTANSS